MTTRPPQGAMTPAQRDITPAEEAAFATIEAEMGGRGRLVAALSTAQLPKDLTQVLGMIADPLHDHESLAKICALGNVGLAKLLKMFQEAVRTRSHLIAHTRIAEKLPDVAAAVMEAATPGWRPCLNCLATGIVTVVVPDRDAEGKIIPEAFHDERKICGTCQGRKQVWYEPEHEAQKTALKIGGILDTGKKGAGVNLSVLQQNTQINPQDTGNYDRMMEALDGVLYGQGRERLARGMAGAVEVGEGGAVESPTADPGDEAGDTVDARG